MSNPKPYFLKYLFGGITCLALSIYLFRTTQKNKKEFNKITGTVRFISTSYHNLPIRDYGKYRYIKIANYARPFEIFVGKDKGDFSPALEKIDSVKPGELLTFYFADDIGKTRDTVVNRRTYYIDRESVPVFIFSSAIMHLSLFLILISVTIIVIVLVGKIRGK
jgi:hypothetical protein